MAERRNGTDPQLVPVLPVNTPGAPHPRSLMWLVKKDWSILPAPLLGLCIGGVLSLYVGPLAAFGMAVMGFILGFVAILSWWANQILPVKVFRKVTVRGRDGAEITQTIRRKEWWSKEDARALGESALRGGTYYIDAQDTDDQGNEIQLVFNPDARQPIPDLSPQMIRFVVAHEPTRIKYKASLFSLSREALTTGASLIFIVIELFVIVWAIGQLQAL